MSAVSLFDDPTILLILTYAPAGFGHLRVMDALYHGLPEGVNPIILGANDPSITYIHRLFSTHPLTRAVMELAQTGYGEALFAKIYRYQLRHSSGYLYHELAAELTQRIHIPKTVVVVATHFGLAHQFAQIKNRFEAQFRIKIILIVIVTDDTSQRIWYVDGADMIMVPSEHTKRLFEKLPQPQQLPPTEFVVNPYPISPLLGEALHTAEVQKRRLQVEPQSHARIHVAVPISGAAVGTDWFLRLMADANHVSDRFVFHVLCKKAPFTLLFLQRVRARAYVELVSAEHDREVVELYETLYAKRTIALEITKPSEQAFKALFTPRQVGGSILLFAQPVGRQERENLDFLRRHNLIPTAPVQTTLWTAARNRAEAPVDASGWRGVLLPADASEAAQFISWCLANGVFLAMQASPEQTELEIRSNGVALFWQKVIAFVERKRPKTVGETEAKAA